MFNYTRLFIVILMVKFPYLENKFSCHNKIWGGKMNFIEIDNTIFE